MISFTVSSLIKLLLRNTLNKKLSGFALLWNSTNFLQTKCKRTVFVVNSFHSLWLPIVVVCLHLLYCFLIYLMICDCRFWLKLCSSKRYPVCFFKCVPCAILVILFHFVILCLPSLKKTVFSTSAPRLNEESF
jgi:hypothetical protein